jgi:hypothetical protein
MHFRIQQCHALVLLQADLLMFVSVYFPFLRHLMLRATTTAQNKHTRRNTHTHIQTTVSLSLSLFPVVLHSSSHVPQSTIQFDFDFFTTDCDLLEIGN